jgi:hypothetical protein
MCIVETLPRHLERFTVRLSKTHLQKGLVYEQQKQQKLVSLLLHWMQREHIEKKAALNSYPLRAQRNFKSTLSCVVAITDTMKDM